MENAHVTIADIWLISFFFSLKSLYFFLNLFINFDKMFTVCVCVCACEHKRLRYAHTILPRKGLMVFELIIINWFLLNESKFVFLFCIPLHCLPTSFIRAWNLLNASNELTSKIKVSDFFFGL